MSTLQERFDKAWKFGVDEPQHKANVLYFIQSEIEQAKHEAREEMRKGLQEIAKGTGEFSRDPLEHAENTIENMKEIANKLLSHLQSPIAPETKP